MTVKSSISLSDEHHAFARAQVQDGRFTSVSAVVQHGLDLLRQKAEDERLERAALRALLEERLAGPFISNDEMRRRIGVFAASRSGDPAAQ
ncbi:ribbon-helix-helix domain-containing protein [Paracoccus aminophilus]|uniref:Antitoxin (ParD-type) of toxin-antitoxin system n=1 Tax=Paracoccus aminophilus JCM 7686 TaxID=1367847 RepID=S5Y227_PARAH|nr:type II toxin-antitoxin system ParD family antitoxin [Paracoccus aminophilus]AGT11507.1 antitoxin (ParD-type) of toxin-antitoxin system [Paracoccus aminophilus JCM 7686]